MRFYFAGDDIKRIAAKSLQIIVERTLDGIDRFGRPFKPYSSKGFSMPYAAIPKRASKVLLKNGELKLFRRNKILFAFVSGGYVRLKSQINSKTTYDGKPNLTLTGRMLESLKVVELGENYFKIGFTLPEQAQKAQWNAERGREFLGLSPNDLDNSELKQAFVEGLKFDA